MTGVCVATFFPMVVAAAYDPSKIWLTLLIPLGGLFGYLPDFLDFKFTRYTERADFFISPGYKELDPWRVASQVAEAINQAYTSDKPVKIKLRTIKMPNGLWRRYSVLFRLKERAVEVKIGPLITTGLEVVPGSEPEEERVAVVKYKPELYYSYEDVTNVDIWDGPTFQFRREGTTIYADFIQWHRRWSHSLTLGVFFGLLMAGVAGLVYRLQGVTLTDLQILTVLGVVIGGMWGHILVDQLGWLGSNLFWPITGKRKTGMGLTRSMDPLGNFITTYLLTMLILWNLNYYAPEPVFQWTFVQFLVFYIALPISVVVAATTIHRRKQDKIKRTRDQEEMDEVSMEIAYF
ncbi:MAG: metal-dependent hydrolase [Promethearchaeota archaeon]